MAYPNGYKGELNRFAGDASEQRAKAFARQHGHAQVVFHPDFKLRGISNCFVVLDYDAPKPEGSHVVALFEEKAYEI